MQMSENETKRLVIAGAVSNSSAALGRPALPKMGPVRRRSLRRQLCLQSNSG